MSITLSDSQASLIIGQLRERKHSLLENMHSLEGLAQATHINAEGSIIHDMAPIIQNLKEQVMSINRVIIDLGCVFTEPMDGLED
jgi:hypothetical protein